MPFASTIMPGSRLLRTRITFPLSFLDIRRHADMVRRDGTWAYAELVDARAIGRVDFSARDLIGVARAVREILGERPLAPRAVIVDTERGFMMGRVFAGLVAGWCRIGIFEDAATAEDWLAAQTDEIGTT